MGSCSSSLTGSIQGMVEVLKCFPFSHIMAPATGKAIDGLARILGPICAILGHPQHDLTHEP